MFKHRRIAALVSIFAIGVVFGILLRKIDTLYFRAVFMALAIASGLICLFSARSERNEKIKRISAAALAVAAFSIGVLRVSVSNSFFNSTKHFVGKTDNAEFVVAEVNSGSIDARVYLSETGIPNGETVRLYLDNIPDSVVAGDSFKATVKYSHTDNIYIKASGISMTGYGEITEFTEGSSLLCRLRRSVSESSLLMYEDFDSASQLSKSVIVGDRSGMDSYIFAVYNNSGISHLLAISGLHLAIIAMGVYSFLVSLSVNRRICAIAGVLTALGYTALVGFIPGAVRSAVMISMLLLSRMFMRRSDSFTALFLSLALLLIVNPYSIASASLQLSFLCSIGIMLSEPLTVFINSYFIEKKHLAKGAMVAVYKLIPALITPALVSLVASVFSFPVLFFSFDSFSYISPFVNVLAVPIFNLALKFALIAALLYTVFPVIASFVAIPAGYIFDIVTDFSEWLYHLNVGSISLHSALMVIPAVLSVAIIASLLFSSRCRRKSTAVFAVAFCVSLVFCRLYDIHSISNKTIVEYGNTTGEYIYFCSEGKNIYLDLGGKYTAVDTVFENRMSSLNEYVVLSYDNSVTDRFKKSSEKLKISSVYLPNPRNDFENLKYSEIKVLCERRKCDIIVYTDVISEKLGVGDIFISGYNENDSSKESVNFTIGETEISFLGNGYKHTVTSDISVLLGDYNDSFMKLKSEKIYTNRNNTVQSNGNVERFAVFDRCLRMEFEISESDCKIYEP